MREILFPDVSRFAWVTSQIRDSILNPRSGPCSLIEVWRMMCPSFRVSLGHFSKWVLQLTKISAPKTLCPYHGTYTIRIRIFTFCLSGSPGAGYRVKSCWWMTDIGFCHKYEGLQWLGGLQWLDACFFTYYLFTVSYWDITPIYPSVYCTTVLCYILLIYCLSSLPACTGNVQLSYRTYRYDLW